MAKSRDKARQGDGQELAQVREQIEVLQQSIVAAKPGEMRILWDNLEQTEREIYRKNADIDELKKQLNDGQDDDVRQLRSDYDGLVREIKALEDGIENTAKALGENSVNRERIQKQIDQKSGGRLKGASDRVAMAAKLQLLFDRR